MCKQMAARKNDLVSVPVHKDRAHKGTGSDTDLTSFFGNFLYFTDYFDFLVQFLILTVENMLFSGFARLVHH